MVLPRLPSVVLAVELSLVHEGAELLSLVLALVISRVEGAAERLSDVLAVETSQLMYAELGALSDIIEFICMLPRRIANRMAR